MKRTQGNKYKKNYTILNFLERRIVIIFAIIVLAITCLTLPTWNNINKVDIILTSLITIIVTLMGALITALTILIAIMNTKSIKEICKNNLWGNFINYFISPIIVGIILIFYTLYTMIILKTTYVNKIDIMLISVLSTMFMVGILRVGYILILIMKQIPELEYNNDGKVKGTEIDKEDVKSKLK